MNDKARVGWTMLACAAMLMTAQIIVAVIQDNRERDVLAHSSCPPSALEIK